MSIAAGGRRQKDKTKEKQQRWWPRGGFCFAVDRHQLLGLPLKRAGYC
jgi:hypothetical protein